MNLRAATVPALAQPEVISPVVPRPTVASGEASMYRAWRRFYGPVRQVNPTFYKNLAELRQNFQQRPDEAADRKQKRNLPTAVLANFKSNGKGRKCVFWIKMARSTPVR